MGIGTNASGDYAKRTGSPAITMTGDTDKVTLSGWLKIRDMTPGAYAIPFGFENADTSATAWAVWYIANDDHFEFGTNTSNSGDVTHPTEGTWYYFYIIGQNTADGDIDWNYGYYTATGSSPVVSGTIQDNDEWNIVRVCVLNDSYDEWVDAVAAQVRVWTGVALTDAELRAERDSPVAVKTSGLWADWSLDDNTDTADDSGNGRTLTFGGTLTSEEEPPNVSFTASTVLDNFNRTENPLSTNWAQMTGVASYSHRANGTIATFDSATGVVVADYYTAALYADPAVFFTLPTIATDTNTSVGVCARIKNPASVTTIDFYMVEYTTADGGTISLFRCIDTVYGSPLVNVYRALSAGHKLGMTVEGHGATVTIRIYTDEGSGWVLRDTYYDTSANRITGSGFIAIHTYRSGTDTFSYDDFGGYDVPALVYDVVSFAARTSTGSQEVAHGLGVTPNLMICFANDATAQNGTIGNPNSFTVGATDGATSKAFGVNSQDNASTIVTTREGDDAAVYRHLYDGDYRTDYATLSAWDSDSFTLSWTRVLSDAFYVTAILISGLAGAEVVADNVTDDDTTPTAVQADGVFAFSHGNDFDGVQGSGYGGTTLGAAYDTGSGIDNRMQWYYEQVSLDDGAPQAGFHDDGDCAGTGYIGIHRSYGIDAIGANTLTWAWIHNNTFGLSVGVVPITMPSGKSLHVGHTISPTSTGTQDITSLGFKPGLVILFGGSVLSAGKNTDQTAGNSVASFFMAASDGASHACASQGAEVGAATSNTYNAQSSTNVIHILNGTGSSTLAQASMNAFLSNGFQLNWSQVNGSEQYLFGWLAFEEEGGAPPTEVVKDIIGRGIVARAR